MCEFTREGVHFLTPDIVLKLYDLYYQYKYLILPFKLWFIVLFYFYVNIVL